MRKRTLSLMLLVTLCVGGNVFAQVEYVANGVEGSWYDNGEGTAWGGAASPVLGDTAYIQSGSTVTLDADGWVTAMGVGTWSDYSSPDTPDFDTLSITNSATLYTNGWVYIGNTLGDVGVVNIGEGCTFDSSSVLNLGYNGAGIMNVYGTLKVPFSASPESGLYVQNPWADGTGSGVLNVYAGGVVTGWMEIGPNGMINIESGLIRLEGDFWGTSWSEHLGPMIGTQIVAYGGAGTVEMTVVEGITEIRGFHPYQPNPAIGGTAEAGEYEMTWVFPDPNHPSGVITCDVYLSDTFQGESVSQGDPNFPNYANKEVDGESVESVTVTLEALKNYYWRIDIHDTSADDPIIGDIFTFDTMNGAPSVDAGDDVLTWLAGGTVAVNLSGSVEDDGLPDPPGSYTVVWEVISEPVEGAAEITTAVDELDISVTLSEVGDYLLKLTADDDALTGSDAVLISVYTDNCEAAKGIGVELLEGDINEDCVVGLADLAAMAANWQESMAL